MSLSAVQTVEDEVAWEQAKQITTNEYPDVTGSNYWRIVMDLFTNMTHYVPKSDHGEHDPAQRMTR